MQVFGCFWPVLQFLSLCYYCQYVFVKYWLRLKIWPGSFNGSGGSGYWARGSNLLVETAQSFWFEGMLKDCICTGLVPRLHIPSDPHTVFLRFLVSGIVNWGQIPMFRASKERLSVREWNTHRKTILGYLQFLGSLFF